MAAMKQTVDFTKAEVWEHFEYVFGGTHGYVCAATLDRSEGPNRVPDHRFYRWPTEADALVSDVVRFQDQAWTEVLYCPYPLQEKARAVNTSVSRRVVHCDVDQAPSEALRAWLRAWGFRVVASGTPGNVHVYARLSRSLTLDEHRAVQVALRTKVGSDDKIADNDLLKVPGGWNYKNHPNVPEAKRNAEAYPVAVTHPGRRRVNADALIAELRATVKRTAERAATEDLSYDRAHYPYPDRKMRLDASQAVLHHRSGDNSEDTYHLVAALAERGFSLSEIIGVAFEHAPTTEKRRTSKELIDDVHRIYSKVKPADLVPLTDEEFWTARPELEHIRTFARSRRASPWAVFGVVMVRVVGEVPSHLVLPPLVGKEVSLNLFVGLVGVPGGGKDSAVGVAEAAIQDHGNVAVLNVGSGEAIAHAFVEATKDGVQSVGTGSVLFQIGEIDTFASLTQRRGATLMPELRKAYMGERLGFHYVDKTKRLAVAPHQYRMGVVAGIQPARAGVLLDDADGGTPQRFIWLPATDPEVPDERPPTPGVWDWKPPHPLPTEPGGLVHMVICDEARTLIDKAAVDRLKGKGQALDGHALLARLKVAAALTLLNGRTDINDQDWWLAGLVMARSNDTRARVIETLARKQAADARQRAVAEADRAVVVADRIEERETIKRVAQLLLEKVKGYGADGGARADLRRALPSRDRPHFDPAMQRLVDAGDVREDKSSGGQRYHAR